MLSTDARYFLAIAESRSLSRASDIAGVSQPALSKSVRKLERRYSVQLIVRGPRGVALTPAGESLKARLQLIAHSVAEAETEIRDTRGGYAGRLKLGAGVWFADKVLLDTLTSLVQRRSTTVTIYQGVGGPLFDLLRQGLVDVVVSALPAMAPEDLEQRALFSGSVVLVARKAHPVFARAPRRLADLSRYRWALPDMDAIGRMALNDMFRANGVPPPAPVIECMHIDPGVYARIVANSDLLGIVPDRFLDATSSGLRPLPISLNRLRRLIGLSVRRVGYTPPIARLFIEQLIEFYERESVHR